MHPCLVASYDKPRGLKAADKFFVPLPAGGENDVNYDDELRCKLREEIILLAIILSS